MIKKSRYDRKSKWSRYRCSCNATYSGQCVCSDIGLKTPRVFFKDLERRNLNALFTNGSKDQIVPPYKNACTMNQLIFKG